MSSCRKKNDHFKIPHCSKWATTLYISIVLCGHVFQSNSFWMQQVPPRSNLVDTLFPACMSGSVDAWFSIAMQLMYCVRE